MWVNRLTHTVTHTTKCVERELAEATACQWIAPQDIEAFPLPAPHRKLADNCSLFDNPASGE